MAEVALAGGGELSPSKSNVLLLWPLDDEAAAAAAVGEDNTADALLNSSWGRPVLGLWPVDCKGREKKRISKIREGM